MAEPILTSSSNHVLQIRFNRPERKNAITTEMYRMLADTLEGAESDPDIRVILFSGDVNFFSSGNDLGDILNNPLSSSDSPPVRFMRVLPEVTKIMMAAVNGLAIGIGVTMLLNCDLVYAGKNSVFQLPFVNLGVCPEAGASYYLPALMGHMRAAELLFFGESFNADKAYELGMINKVLEPEEVYEYSLNRARKLATQAPNSLRITKELLRKASVDIIRRTMQEEVLHLVKMLDGHEVKEALNAFMEKRSPDFDKFELTKG